ncbi:MAG: hypothetical protein JSV92_02690 [archaeon]|nr:MAG: hypothetical protein JSV92_02690 [archaeon]
MEIKKSEMESFVKKSRETVGRDEKSPFSLEDAYYLSQILNLDGVLYIEKFDNTRHVNVLLDLGRENVTLYDPLKGVKTKTLNEIQMGMYCKPVGKLKEEFDAYIKKSKTNEPDGIWFQYKSEGELLFDFLINNDNFKSIYSENVPKYMPILQNDKKSSDCVPISLFIISLFNSLYSKS